MRSPADRRDSACRATRRATGGGRRVLRQESVAVPALRKRQPPRPREVDAQRPHNRARVGASARDTIEERGTGPRAGPDPSCASRDSRGVPDRFPPITGPGIDPRLGIVPQSQARGRRCARDGAEAKVCCWATFTRPAAAIPTKGQRVVLLTLLAVTDGGVADGCSDGRASPRRSAGHTG